MMTSACIVTCGREDMLRNAISRIRLQTVPVDEIVVVFDGPEPDCDADVVVRGRGLGIAAARNDAIANASGCTLLWCDDDEEWRPTLVERILPLVGPDSPVCHGDVSIVEGRWNHDHFDVTSDHGHGAWCGEVSFSSLCFANTIPHTALVVRREVYDEVGMYDETTDLLHDDWDLMLRITASGMRVVHACDGGSHATYWIWEGQTTRDLPRVNRSVQLIRTRIAGGHYTRTGVGDGYSRGCREVDGVLPEAVRDCDARTRTSSGLQREEAR